MPRLASISTRLRAHLAWGGLAAAAWLLALPGAAAATYLAPLDQARWEVERSASRCRLSQSIPRFGAAVFEAGAGRGQQFYLAPEQALRAGGTGQLVAAAPFWNPDRPAVELGPVLVSADRRPLQLQDPLAQRLLQQLGDGMVPELHLEQAHGTLRVGVLPVYFRRAYQEYRACAAKLPAPPAPAPVARLDNRVRFEANRDQLDAAGRAQLDRLARRLLDDPGIGKIVVEGHSSDSYRRVLNLELSRRRAEAVTTYLIERGIDRGRITTRYFGQRYAAAADRSVRHVEVRLLPVGEKQEPAQKPQPGENPRPAEKREG